MEFGGATIDVVALSVAVALCAILVIRALRRETRPYRLAGLVWMARWNAYWGPCCEACLNQYALRPTIYSPDAVQYYELYCPICQASLQGQVFTLRRLLDLEQEAAANLRRPRAGVPLAACVIGVQNTYRSI